MKNIKPSNQKQHHVVHRAYLENFTDESKFIYRYDKATKKHIRSKPRETGTQGYYYSFTTKSGEISNALENLIGGIETKASSLLKKLIKVLSQILIYTNKHKFSRRN